MDVSVRREADGRFLVELAETGRDVEIHLSATDVTALVTSALWHTRGTLQAGESAGAPVFWASDGDRVRLLIGHDRETPDGGMTVPLRAVDQIILTAIRSAVPVTVTQSYERPPPDADLVGTLQAALASVPDLQGAYLVTRRNASPEGEKSALGVVAQAGGGGSHSGRSEALRVALAPFSPPNESAPLGWVAYSSSPVPDEVRDAGIRLA